MMMTEPLYTYDELHMHHDFIAEKVAQLAAGKILTDLDLIPYMNGNNVPALERCAIIDQIYGEGY